MRCHDEYDLVFGNTRVNEYPVATPNAINAVFKPRVECLTACVLLMLVVDRRQSSCVRRACARECVTSRGASSAFFRHSYDDTVTTTDGGVLAAHARARASDASDRGGHRSSFAMTVTALASCARTWTRCDARSCTSSGLGRRRAPPPVGCGRRGASTVMTASLASDRTPIEKLFTLVTEDVVVDHERQVTVKVVRPRDEDEVVEYYVERMMNDADPYWAVLWPSARAVSRYIARAPALVRDKAVCDLGAGLGLAGLAACACGAKKVALYDRERLAMECALLSIEANGFGDRVYVEEFDWNVIHSDQEKFDTLLACDVLYEEAAVGPVAELVPRLVKQGGGRFLLGDPPLRAPQNRAKFKSILCDQYGAFLMRELSVTEVTESGEDDELVFIDFKL